MFIEYKNIIELLSISKVKLPKEPDQEDIVKFVPRKYIDFTHPQGATFENVGNEVCMCLHLNDYKEGKTTTHITYFVGHCIDKITNKKSECDVVWSSIYAPNFVSNERSSYSCMWNITLR